MTMFTSKVTYGEPKRPPNQDMIPLRKAMKAKNAIRLAMILSTKKTAFAAPCAAASRALASVL
jgi:hypothetical protein